MDQASKRRELFQELGKKVIGKYVTGKGYKAINKKLHVTVTMFVNIIRKIKFHGTVASQDGA